MKPESKHIDKSHWIDGKAPWTRMGIIVKYYNDKFRGNMPDTEDCQEFVTKTYWGIKKKKRDPSMDNEGRQ
jgi:hypothetical protein